MSKPVVRSASHAIAAWEAGPGARGTAPNLHPASPPGHGACAGSRLLTEEPPRTTPDTARANSQCAVATAPDS